MHRLFIALLMIFSVATGAVAPTHSARIAIASQEITSTHGSQHSIAYATSGSCRENRFCAGSDRLCYIVCFGTATWLAPEQAGTATDTVAAIWALPGTPNVDGLGPERNERPPNDGLAESHRLPTRTPN